MWGKDNMIEVNGSNYAIFVQKTKEIDDKLFQIDEDTKIWSMLSKTYEHEQFKELVAMGTKIIPYIFYKMTQDETSWVHLCLLQELVGNEMIIPEEYWGRFEHIITFWMQWYIKSRYINHDVYYGLV